MIKFIRRIVVSLLIFLAANIPLLHKTGIGTAWCGENIKDFDVRGFYVELVNGLKERGL